MKNNDLLIQKITCGIKYLEEQEEKLQPVLDYLTEILIEKQEELTAKEAFDFYIRLQEQKTNSLLLLTKMKEILDYKEF